MSQKIFFFSNKGKCLYTRSDAIEFEHNCLNMTCEGTFPYSGNIPQTAQLVGWIDVDGNWEIQEIVSTETEADGESITISGTNLAVSELSRYTVAGNVKVTDKRFKSAMTTILGDRTSWQIGKMPKAGEDDPEEAQRFRVIKSVPMYSEASTSSSVLKTYAVDTYLNLIEISDTWYHMQATDGREGYLADPVDGGYIVRDGYKDDDQKTISIDEDYANLWDLLSQCSEQTGYIISPRILVTDGTISSKYLDVESTDVPYGGVRLNVNTNIVEATVKYSIENMYTSMIGIGKDDLKFSDVVWDTDDGYPVNKPKGQTYVSIPSKVSEYGTRRGVVTFNEITSKTKLLYRTYEYLKSMSEPTISIEGTIADLYSLGYSGTPLHVYDTVYVYIEPIGLKVALKVTDLTRDLVDPEKTNAVIGTLNDDDFIVILAGRKG